MRHKWILASALAIAALSSTAHAAWAATGFVKFDIRMDNGVTYLYPALPNGSLSYPLGGNCQWNRLVIDNAGDNWGSVENGKRMYAMLLTARAQGLRVDFGYDDTSGPHCRLAQLFVEWNN